MWDELFQLPQKFDERENMDVILSTRQVCARKLQSFVLQFFFAKDQVERDVFQRLGYANARIRLKRDAVPDVPLRVQKAVSLVLSLKTQKTFA